MVRESLEGLKVPLTVNNLLYRGALIALPQPDDFPGLGWWTADEVAQAATVFQTLDLQQLDETTAKQVLKVSDAIEAIRSWVDVAGERPGDCLIGVHS
jgi:hypothetical protein